jgi:hypothetical protein
MKSSSLYSLLLAASASAFAPAPAFTTSRSAVVPAETVLFISSWGKGGAASRQSEKENENPEERIQAYIKAPGSIGARSNIDGTVLVSGLVKSKDRSDQFLFDLLNHEESAFEFKKIVAHVDDIKFSKKRLLSRSARYSGLLDKLDFTEASAPGALPTKEQLDGVKTWVAILDGGDLLATVKEIGATAKGTSIENISILLTNAFDLDAAACKDAVESIKAEGIKYSMVAVGKLEEHAEGKIPYQYKDFGSDEGVLAPDAVFSRNEALRMISECLQLECGVDKALTFSEVYNVNATEAKLIKGLREAGYTRPQEIDHMIRVGTGDYQKAIDEFKERNPDHAKGYYTTDAWWLDEKFQASVNKTALRKEQAVQRVKDERTESVEKIAKEWVKREYFKQSMAGTVDDDMTEAKFKTSVWDRAMFEGDLKYRQMNGEAPDTKTKQRELISLNIASPIQY